MPRRRIKRHLQQRGDGTTYYDDARRQWVSQLPAALAGKRLLRRFAGEADAVDWRLRELERLRAGRVGSDPSIPFGRYLRAWLEVHRVGLARTTAANYSAAVRSVGELAALPLRDLTHRDFAALWAQLQRDGLAPSTVRLHRRILAIALNAAVPDLIPANPLRRAPGPRLPEAAVERWEEADAARFLLAADQTPLALYFRLALGIGARPSELRALQRGDYRPAEGTLLIERSLSESGRVVGPTKTRRSREVYLPAPCVQALEQHLDGRRDTAPWLFCHPPSGKLGGQPYGRSVVALVFERLLASVTPPLPPVTLYALRHTCATLMLANGIPLADVSYILGHADASTTLRIYARWLVSNRRRAAEVMGAVQPPFQGVGNTEKGRTLPEAQPDGPIRERIGQD